MRRRRPTWVRPSVDLFLHREDREDEEERSLDSSRRRLRSAGYARPRAVCAGERPRGIRTRKDQADLHGTRTGPHATAAARGATSPVGGVTGRRADASGTQPRAALVASLAEGLAAAFAAGDVEAARVAHEAIGRLLAMPQDHGGTLVDLATERTAGRILKAM